MDAPNIVLIGFMGSGKTSISNALATLTNFELIDTDTLIETQSGQTIGEIFSKNGESHFRKLENQLCQSLKSKNHCIISTGGGMILDRQNWKCLSENGIIFWVDAPIEEMISRVVSEDTDRPLATHPEELKKLYLSRQAIYQDRSHHHLNTMGETPDDTARKIWALFNG